MAEEMKEEKNKPLAKDTSVMAWLLKADRSQQAGIVDWLEYSQYHESFRCDATAIAWWHWKEEWRASCIKAYNNSDIGKAQPKDTSTSFEFPEGRDFQVEADEKEKVRCKPPLFLFKLLFLEIAF